MAQDEEKLFEFNWKWTSIIPIAVLGIVEATAWPLIEDFPKWAKLSITILGLLFIGAYNIAAKCKAK